MAVAVGQFDIPVSTGNVSVTGLSFQPVAVVFWNTLSDRSPPGEMLGCATASDEQWVIWTGMDAETSGYTVRYNEGRTDVCIYNLAAPFTTVRYAASLVSLNSDGFTVNFTTRTGIGEPVYYMAIGGQHIPGAFAGTFTVGASTGTTAITDPGFLPSALIVAHQRSAAFDAGQQGDMAWGVGVTDGVNQYSSFAMGNQGSALEGYHIHRTDSIACSWGGADAYRSALSSFDANGFTVDVTDAWTGGDITHGYLAINADAAAAGSGTVPDATGTQQFTGLPLKPAGVFFCWNGVDAPSTTGSGTLPLRPGVGGFTDTTGRAISQIFRDSTSFGVWTPDGYRDAAAIIGVLVRGEGNGIVDPPAHNTHAYGVYSAFDQGSFTINWTTATAGADRAFGWLALPGELPVNWIPQIYRLVMPT